MSSNTDDTNKKPCKKSIFNQKLRFFQQALNIVKMSVCKFHKFEHTAMFPVSSRLQPWVLFLKKSNHHFFRNFFHRLIKISMTINTFTNFKLRSYLDKQHALSTDNDQNYDSLFVTLHNNHCDTSKGFIVSIKQLRFQGQIFD